MIISNITLNPNSQLHQVIQTVSISLLKDDERLRFTQGCISMLLPSKPWHQIK